MLHLNVSEGGKHLNNSRPADRETVSEILAEANKAKAGLSSTDALVAQYDKICQLWHIKFGRSPNNPEDDLFILKTIEATEATPKKRLLE